MGKSEDSKKQEILRVMEYTLMNFDCMWKRLNRKAHFASFVLVYYSIFLIIYSLTQIVFKNYYHEALSSYFNIIVSIVVLVYSLVNSNARYNERISSIKAAIDSVKEEKRSLTLEIKTYEEAKKVYDSILAKVEHREDIDFFSAVKLLCKKHDIKWWKIRFFKIDQPTEEQKRIIDYLNQMNPFYLQFRIIIEMVGYAVLTIIPFVIFIICIFAKIQSWIL